MASATKLFVIEAITVTRSLSDRRILDGLNDPARHELHEHENYPANNHNDLLYGDVSPNDPRR